MKRFYRVWCGVNEYGEFLILERKVFGLFWLHVGSYVLEKDMFKAMKRTREKSYKFYTCQDNKIEEKGLL